MALARKWRPRQFSDLIGQKHVVTALVNALTHNKLHHAYLLTGTRGVGKTTIARILAKCLNCETGVTATPCGECTSCQEIDSGRFIDLYEIDAASRTKVEDTRDLLDNVQYAPTKGRYKVYLIDEVHMLSGHSFNALLKTLEEPPEHVKFILATTDPEKLPATVLSRCLQFHLLALMPEQIAAHCQMICQQENISAEDEALALLAKAANGSMRDGLSLLDQAIAYGNLKIDTPSVRDMLGTIDPSHLFDIVDALIAKDGDQLMRISQHLVSLGSDFAHILSDFLSLLHQCSVMQIAPNTIDTPDPRLLSASKQLSAESIQLLYQITLIGQRDLELAPSPRAGFEMVLIRLLAFQPQDNNIEPQAKPQPQKQPQSASKTPNNTAAASARTPISKPKPVAQADNKPIPSPSTDQWTQWVNDMPLTGAARVIAQNCCIAEHNDTAINLHLDPSQKPMLQSKYTQRINDALNQLLKKEIKLTIAVAEPNSHTPSSLAKQQQQHNQQQAEQSIQKNEHVQTIMQTFGAEIVSGSISPSDKP